MTICVNYVKFTDMTTYFTLTTTLSPSPPLGGQGGIEDARNAQPLSLRVAEGWQQGG